MPKSTWLPGLWAEWRRAEAILLWYRESIVSPLRRSCSGCFVQLKLLTSGNSETLGIVERGTRSLRCEVEVHMTGLTTYFTTLDHSYRNYINDFEQMLPNWLDLCVMFVLSLISHPDVLLNNQNNYYYLCSRRKMDLKCHSSRLRRILKAFGEQLGNGLRDTGLCDLCFSNLKPWLIFTTGIIPLN